MNEINGMKNARNAGWRCFLSSFAFLPFAVGFAWFSHLLPVAWLLQFLSGCSSLCFVVLFAWGIWGLICGYSETAWNDYVKSSHKREADEIARITK